jgi:hypothetical protein
MVKSTKGNSPEEDTMKPILNIDIDGLHVQLPKSVAAYRHRYPRREQYQPAYLELRFEGDGAPLFFASFNADVGTGVDERFYHDKAIAFGIPHDAYLKDVRNAMRTVAPMCAELCKSYDTRFDGQSIVGVFDYALRDRIQETLDVEFGVERY